MERMSIALSVLVLAGCSAVQPSRSDIAYQVITDEAVVGVMATSAQAGLRVDVYAICDASRREYHISSTSGFRPPADQWSLEVDGGRFWKSDLKFNDEESFLRSINSLAMVSPKKILGGEDRFPIANQDMLKIPKGCVTRQNESAARLEKSAQKNAERNAEIVAEVVHRTGVQPMLTGENQRSFNSLVAMFRGLGIENFVGKFVWAQDGDYFVSQILTGEVVLTSLTNPALFPPITIMTDKQALEGQPWSAVSRGPLQFIGPKQYQTALGVERQVLVFKSI